MPSATACEQYIANRAEIGWKLVPQRYDDGGFTGSNLERPAFQKLMQDVDDRKIDVVVVYKVDRLSRSLLDFAQVMHLFERADVGFVNLKLDRLDVLARPGDILVRRSFYDDRAQCFDKGPRRSFTIGAVP